PSSATDVPILNDLTKAKQKGAKGQKGVKKPDNCGKSGCDWLCSNFFEAGFINMANLAAGGEIIADEDDFTNTTNVTETIQGRLLEMRLLQTGDWDFNDATVGVVVEVSADPANDKPSTTGANVITYSLILFMVLMTIIA